MSGSPGAFDELLANMAHGGRIAVLGHPDRADRHRLQPDRLQQLTFKGIYGREMYETWYVMTSMLQSGLDIGPVITHRFAAADYERAFAAAARGDAGKIILDWEGV